MDIQLIKEFCVFSQYLNYSRAAKELFVSQPTLSAHMSLLEREAGFPLVEGKGQDARLTEAGNMLFAKGQSILARYEELESEFDTCVKSCLSLSRKSHEAIRIFDMQGAIALQDSTIQQAIDSYGLEHPEQDAMRYRLVSEPDHTAKEALEKGLVDIAYVYGSKKLAERYLEPLGGCILAQLDPEPCALFLKDDHLLATKDVVSVADLADYSLVFGNRRRSAQWRYAMEEALARYGVKPTFRMQDYMGFFRSGFMEKGDELIYFGHVSNITQNQVHRFPRTVVRPLDDADIRIGVHAVCLKEKPQYRSGRPNAALELSQSAVARLLQILLLNQVATPAAILARMMAA